jgi:hypothetical protein
MAKKMKLNLAELRVDSFVTSLHDESKALIKGGAPPTYYCSEDPCPVSRPWACPTEPAYPTCGGQQTCGSTCP